MSVGDELQQLSMIESLPHLLSVEDGARIENVVPRMHQALPNGGPELHTVASNTFRTILEQKLVAPSTFTQTFLNDILASVDSRDPMSAKAWLDTLLDIIDLLPSGIVKNDILPVAVARGQLSQSVQSRVTSSELLGKIATKFESTQLQKEVVPLAHSLCQDVSGEVRASMCYQLPHIARGLSPEALKPSLLPLLVELAIDEEPSVRLAAVHTIGSVINILPDDVLKHTITPLLMKLCEQALASENQILCAISGSYGQLCLGLRGALSEKEKVWFVRFFRQMSRVGMNNSEMQDMQLVSDRSQREREHMDLLIHCRQNCAYNFPAMTLFCGPVHFEEALHPTYATLACDRVTCVRLCIAAGIHEVARTLGNSAHLIRPELLVLLCDDSRDVLQSLVPNLALTLQQLAKCGCIGPSVRDTGSAELMRALMKCELVISLTTNWRLHETMLAQLEHLPTALPYNLIHLNLCDVLFHRIEDSRALPCRLAAARTLLVLLRHAAQAEHRKELQDRICTELGSHYSCHTRLMFVKMCGLALDIFSSHYFKEHFFIALLALAGDPVPNVRLVLCSLLPRLKALLRLPSDSLLLSAFQNAIVILTNPVRPDRDVAAKLQIACAEMENILLLSDASNGSMDAEDHSRYQEEQQIELRGGTPEPRKLVTVNMKTLGEGKKATLVSLRSAEPVEQRLTSSVSNIRPSTSVMGNMASSSTAVSSIGLYGGCSGGASRITASISSSSCDSSCNFSSQSKTTKESIATTTIDSGFPMLLEDEFYIDAGVPLPEKLTESKTSTLSSGGNTDTARSKIPNLRELLFQNSTLLAQVANREAAESDLQLKSFSYLKSLSMNKVGDRMLPDNSDSAAGGINKRYSRLFDESSHSDIRYSSLIGRPASSVPRKDMLQNSLHDQNYVQDIEKEVLQKNFSSKGLVSGSPRLSSGMRDTKPTNINRRSFVSNPVQGSRLDGGQGKEGTALARPQNSSQRNGKVENSSLSNRRHAGGDVSGVNAGSAKVGNGVVNRFQNGTVRSNTGSHSQGAHTGIGRSITTTTITMSKNTSEPVSRRHSSMEMTASQDKSKDTLKFSGVANANKRYSFGERNQGLSSATEKKVSLSSIGVNGGRRTFHTGSRPQSCLIMMRQNDKTNKVNSRSLSQESLGVDSGKGGPRTVKRTTMGMIRNENRLSRIPRGGISCHSSPGNSRPASPTNVRGSSTLVTVSHTAPCSPGVSRPASPTGRLQPRVSLASIKLHEPSRLPIRKYNHHM